MTGVGHALLAVGELITDPLQCRSKMTSKWSAAS